MLGLYGNTAPGTVANFLRLVNSGALQQTTFSKVLPGEYIQVCVCFICTRACNTRKLQGFCSGTHKIRELRDFERARADRLNPFTHTLLLTHRLANKMRYAWVVLKRMRLVCRCACVSFVQLRFEEPVISLALSFTPFLSCACIFIYLLAPSASSAHTAEPGYVIEPGVQAASPATRDSEPELDRE